MPNAIAPAGGPAQFEPRRIVVCGPAAAEVARLAAPSLNRVGLRHQPTVLGRASEPAGLVALSAAHGVVMAAPATGNLDAAFRQDIAIARLLSPVPVRLAVAGTSDGGQMLASAWRRLVDAAGGLDPAIYDLPRAADALAEAMASDLGSEALAGKSLRLWVIATERAQGSTVRTLARIVTGVPAVGADLVAQPSGAAARLSAIEPSANDGIVHLTVETVSGPAIEAGDLLCGSRTRAELADQVAAEIVWAADTPMLPGRPYTLRLGPQSTSFQISTLKHRIHPETFEPLAARTLSAGEIGTCNLSFARPMVFDDAAHNPFLARFDIMDSGRATAVGHGVIRYTLRRATNIHWQSLAVGRAERARLKGQTPCCLWLTGLSGSGKSTVASLLEKRLTALGRHTYTLDGDNVRHGLNRDLGFTDADRVENIRRVGEVARLFVDAGLITMVSFISPFRAERRMVRELFPGGDFIEIFVDTPLAVCERRDVKGLYRKARAGELKNFTGIDSPYERPENPEIHLDGAAMDAEAMVEQIYRELERRGIV